MMTGGLRDIETTITKYLVAVHYFLLTLAGIRRLLIFLLLGKKRALGACSLGRLLTLLRQATLRSPLITFGARWTVKSAVLSATLQRRRRHAGGVKVLFISNIFWDSEFNVRLLRPTVIERPNCDGLGYRWGAELECTWSPAFLERCMRIALWYDPWVGLGQVVRHVQSVIGSFIMISVWE